jgi:multidrug efflux pump subunit AcrB
MIGLAAIIMRNPLIFIEQIHQNDADGLDRHDAIAEATIQWMVSIVLSAG